MEHTASNLRGTKYYRSKKSTHIYIYIYFLQLHERRIQINTARGNAEWRWENGFKLLAWRKNYPRLGQHNLLLFRALFPSFSAAHAATAFVAVWGADNPTHPGLQPEAFCCCCCGRGVCSHCDCAREGISFGDLHRGERWWSAGCTKAVFGWLTSNLCTGV